MKTLRIKSIDGDTSFQHVTVEINPLLKENVLIFIKDGGAEFDYDKVKKATDKWTILVVNNLKDSSDTIQKIYKYNENSVKHLVIKSHGHAFTGADLDSRTGQGVIHNFSEEKNSPEVFLRKLLKNDSAVLFTACSIIQSFDKVLKNPKISEKENETNHKKAKETVTNYYKFWIKGTKRNLFIDYTSTSSWNYYNKDKSNDPNEHGHYFSDGDTYWFRFDADLISPKWSVDSKTKIKIKNYFAGFVWFIDNNGNWKNKPDFYQVQIKSTGSITTDPIKNIQTNKMLPDNEKDKKKL